MSFWSSFFLFLLSLIFLIISADRLVKFSARLARKLRLSPLIIGATLIALGTSLPELAVTVSALAQKSHELSLGNLVGSNIANIGLVLGISLIIRPVRVGTVKTQRNNILLLLTTLTFIFLQILNLESRRPLAPILLFISVIFILLEVSWGRDGSLKEDLLSLVPVPREKFTVVDWFYFGGLLALLILSSRFLVSSATSLALLWGISPEVIGLSLVAVGTSLPELSVSVSAAVRKEDKLLLGDLIGSNVLNLALLGSIVVMFADVSSAVHTLSLFSLGAFTILVFLMLRFSSGRTLGRNLGVLLILAYLLYLYFIFR